MSPRLRSARRLAWPHRDGLKWPHSSTWHLRWHMLTTSELYNDLGGDYYTRLNPARQTRRLVAQLERLGHTVTLQEAA